MLKLCIVIPCYNEEEVLPETISRLKDVYHQLETSGLISCESKIIFVNDGSNDDTWEIIKSAKLDDPQMIGGVNLARNYGHQNALLAGMAAASESSDAIITIDADLQDDPNVIHEMINYFNEGCDIVYGVRKERNKDTFFKRTTALAFYKLMRVLGVDSVYNHADYRLMSRRAVEQLLHFRERNLFLRGIVPLIGYKTAKVYYNRVERFAGESKYPLSKMINFAVDGITSFSIKPVRMVLFVGIVFLFVSSLILIYVLYSLFISHNSVSGWASLMLSIWFVGGVLLISLGVVGEYIGKIYIEVKDRPRYNVDSII